MNEPQPVGEPQTPRTALTIVVGVPAGITLEQVADKLNTFELEAGETLLEVRVGSWYQ